MVIGKNFIKNALEKCRPIQVYSELNEKNDFKVEFFLGEGIWLEVEGFINIEKISSSPGDWFTPESIEYETTHHFESVILNVDEYPEVMAESYFQFIKETLISKIKE